NSIVRVAIVKWVTDVLTRRAAKKQQTREAIEEAALRLFEEQGFDATTVAEIAAAADVAVPTFFTHFPSKHAVVLPPDVRRQFDQLIADVVAAPARERPFAVLWRCVEARLPHRGERRDADVRRFRIMASDAGLTARRQAVMLEYQDELVAALVGRTRG